MRKFTTTIYNSDNSIESQFIGSMTQFNVIGSPALPEMVYNRVVKETWTLSNSQGLAFTKILSDLFTTFPGDVVLGLQICARLKITGDGELEEPVDFKVTYTDTPSTNENTFIASNFTLFGRSLENITDPTKMTLEISDVIIPLNRLGELSVLIYINKA